MRHLKICDAKEQFTEELKESEVPFCIIRPNGFFSDMAEYLNMARLTFRALGKEPHITNLPDWLRVAMLKLVRTFTGTKTYGPIEFFLTVMAMDTIAQKYGKYILGEFYKKLCKDRIS